MEKLTKSEFLADFFCSSLAREVFKSLNDVSSENEVVSSLIRFANKLWIEIENAQANETDY